MSEKEKKLADAGEEELGENDTDDEQDFNADEDDEPADPPFLKGKVELNDDGRLYWSGKWGMSKDGFEQGVVQKFKYGGPQVAAQDGDLILANAKYNGYFMVKKEDGEKEKVKEKGISFTFDLKSGTTYTVSATGENKFGEFKIAGEYDCKTQMMECTKQYAGGDDDDDEADDDVLDDDALPPDANEAEDLKADNELTIEELRAKYYGGGGGGDDDDDEPSAKKRKVEAGDDEYDEF
jgi:hypothetical protein